jgi:hypothetical protein
MKKICHLIGLLTVSIFSQAQVEVDPCCYIVGVSQPNNIIIGRNDNTGRLFAFKVSDSAAATLKLQDPIHAMPDYSLITSLNGVSKKYLPEKINAIRVTDDTANTGIGIGLTSFNYDRPCCNIVDIAPSESDALVTAVDKTTGAVIQFKTPAELARGLTLKGPVYFGSSGNLAIVQSTWNSPTRETYLYSYQVGNHVNAQTKAEFATSSWVITPIEGMNQQSGRLHTQFPIDVQWGMEIYSRDKNAVTNPNTKEKQQYLELAPGSYDFVLNSVKVENVPIQFGKETRLKTGFADITSIAGWELYNDTNANFLISGKLPAKVALPAGSYYLRTGGQASPFRIKDGETEKL